MMVAVSWQVFWADCRGVGSICTMSRIEFVYDAGQKDAFSIPLDSADHVPRLGDRVASPMELLKNPPAFGPLGQYVTRVTWKYHANGDVIVEVLLSRDPYVPPKPLAFGKPAFG